MTFVPGDRVTLNGKLFEWESTVIHKKDPRQLHLFKKPTFRVRPSVPLTVLKATENHCYVVVAYGHPTRHRYHEQFLEPLSHAESSQNEPNGRQSKRAMEQSLKTHTHT